jgi:hypothetical protein
MVRSSRIDTKAVSAILSVATCTAALFALTTTPAHASLAWADDPCENNGGQLAVAPDVSVLQADDHPIAYAACADGTLLAHGHAGKGTYRQVEGVAADRFVDVASTVDDNLYALTDLGRVVTVGSAPRHYGDLYPTERAVAIEMTPGDHGYWIVTDRGQVAGFGDAWDLGPTAPTTVQSPIVAFAAYGSSGGWLVTAYGEVVPVGDAPDHGSVVDQVGSYDRAVGIVADRRSGGFWVVTQSGHIIAAGGAADEHDEADCHLSPGGQPPFTGAVGDPHPDAVAPLWLYSLNGGICGFNPGA